MELTKRQIAQQDLVDGSIFELLQTLNPTDKCFGWDIEMISDVRNVIRHWITKKTNCSEQEFYPYIEKNNMTEVQYKIVKDFSDLQKCFSVRTIVFCEEQKCSPSLENDGLDFTALHFLATINDEPIATARMRIFIDSVKIERLAVLKEYRGRGVGKNMFTFILNQINKTGSQKIKLNAQAYLVKFYENFGFIKQGEKFLEANIEHYYMEKEIKYE